MLKIWLKTIKGDKTTAQKTLKMNEPYSKELLEYMIRNILEQMDMPAPVFISAHFSNFEEFKIIRFLPRDFVESVPFDKIEVVDITI